MSKFIMSAHDVAVNAALHAIAAAQNQIELGIKNCGELSAPDAKQSDENKSYFADQARVYKEALVVLQRIRASVSAFK